MRILISILSQYLQPNFLLIKEMTGKYDKLMFVTTEYTDKNKKTEHLCKALGIPVDEVGIISLGSKETNYREIVELLEEKKFPKTDEYILNLTGGTKIIPIAIFEFFMNNGYNADFFYVPEGKNVLKNISSGEENKLGYQLNLKEYFSLQGLQFEPAVANYGNYMKPEEIYDIIKRNRFDRLEEMYTSFYGGNILNVRGANAILEKYSTQKRSHKFVVPDSLKKYLCGEWFEEYCFNRLKSELALNKGSVVKGSRIFKNNPDEQNNEVDVMFIKENQLYFFECKVINKDWDSSKIDPYLYKLAAITKNYGLRVRSYLLTLCDMDPNTKKYQMLAEKLNVLGIKVLGYQDFENKLLNL